MKKIKFNYLLIGVVTLLMAISLWPNFSWFSASENRIAAIQARGVLRISTISSPITWVPGGKQMPGFDDELAQQFARYLGVRLQVTIRQNINQLFDDLDAGRADLLAAGLVYNAERSRNYQPGPTYYSVSQQLVYRIGGVRPKSLANLKENQLVLSSGIAVLSNLKTLKAKNYPRLDWRVEKTNSNTLLEKVVNGEIAYTIADSVAINLFQRIHPQLAVALDVTDEQPVTWFSLRDKDDSLNAAQLDFFNRINEDGTLARLEEKYLGHMGSFDYVDTRSFLRAVDNVLPELQPLFEKYATHFDWQLLAAIAWQESHWDAQATSPTGVRGIMMLTRTTAQSLGLTDRLNAEQSISGGVRYLKTLMDKLPDTVPESERIWFALAAYNMGYAHILDARTLTARQKGNPNSWADVKQRLPLLSQKAWYAKTASGYARGQEAYNYVENIRKYQLSLMGYLQEKIRRNAAQSKKTHTQGKAPVSLPELAILIPGQSPSGSFFQGDAGGKTHSAAPSTLLPAPLQ